MERSIIDLEGQPISSCPSFCVAINAPLLDCCRPGQWCGTGIRRHQESWIVTASDEQAIAPPKLSQELALAMELVPGNWLPTKVTADAFSARFFTPMCQWVDAVDATLQADGQAVQVGLVSGSAGVCPSSCVCSPCCSVLCCCFPFKDHGKNRLHCEELKAHLLTVRTGARVVVLERANAAAQHPHSTLTAPSQHPHSTLTALLSSLCVSEHSSTAPLPSLSVQAHTA